MDFEKTIEEELVFQLLEEEKKTRTKKIAGEKKITTDVKTGLFLA